MNVLEPTNIAIISKQPQRRPAQHRSKQVKKKRKIKILVKVWWGGGLDHEYVRNKMTTKGLSFERFIH